MLSSVWPFLHQSQEAVSRFVGVVLGWLGIATLPTLVVPPPNPAGAQSLWPWVYRLQQQPSKGSPAVGAKPAVPRRHLSEFATAHGPPLPIEILPNLYLSDLAGVLDIGRLLHLGITHVLSTSGRTPQIKAAASMFAKAGIVHLVVSGEDEEDYQMLPNHWGECSQFIAAAQEGGGKVAVHCQAGINRSGVVVAAATMIQRRLHVVAAVEHCRQRRGTMLWNKGFQMQLCELAREQGLLGPRPAGFSDEPPPSLPPPPKAVRALDRLI